MNYILVSTTFVWCIMHGVSKIEFFLRVIFLSFPSILTLLLFRRIFLFFMSDFFLCMCRLQNHLTHVDNTRYFGVS
jgi:hypothetical protein